MQEDMQYADELYFASRQAADIRDRVTTFSNWVAFGHTVEQLDFTPEGVMVFPSKFLDSMQLPEIPEDQCWDKEHMPYVLTLSPYYKYLTSPAILHELWR